METIIKTESFKFGNAFTEFVTLVIRYDGIYIIPIAVLRFLSEFVLA